MRLKDKVIVVTGGAGLLGRAFCKSISEEGGIAVIADISLKQAQEVSTLIPNSIALEIDITKKESIFSVIESLHQKFRRIDALVNNAYPRNKNYGRKVLEVEYSDYCENVNLNLGGYFLTSQQFIEYFLKQGFGNIVNIASIYGVMSPRFEIYENTEMTMPVEYSVIKSGLIHLTKYLAKYVKGNGIRINALSPGGVLDGQPKPFLESYKKHASNKGMLDPSDLAGTLIYLLSDESKYLNGQNIVVDDGFSL